MYIPFTPPSPSRGDGKDHDEKNNSAMLSPLFITTVCIK
jgi:hypothetical protein